MYLCKILFLVGIGLLCTNARVLKKKTRQRFSAPSCGCPIPLQPTYGTFGSCNCQNMFLDELSNCGCKYIETYGVLNPELPNYNRVPVIRLPKMGGMSVASCDATMPVGIIDAGMPVGNYDVLPAINLPGLFELTPQGMPCVSECPCSCQAPMAFQFVETCGCRMPSPIVELSSPVLKIPTESCTQAQICLPQLLQLPSCGCQSMPCGCQNKPCGCRNKPCSCQDMPCGCQSMPCACQNMPCSCQNMPCGCQTYLGQNVFGPQLPMLESPCACQACQLAPVELPVYGYGCQSLPPPVVGCGGKYLRQVTIPPPFL